MNALWTKEELLAAVGGKAEGSFNANGVAFDSREIGQGDLFFAMKGEATDGHLFVDKAFTNGAAGAIVSEPIAYPHILVDDTMEALNALGERTRAAGVRLAYPNHADEFTPFGGGPAGYDVLLDETDPALVSMELDVFWAVHAGHDPVDWLSRFPGRFPLLHVKDRAASGAMTDVGAGEIDVARIIECAAQGGLEHIVVEHDEPTDALASVRDSYAALARLGLRHS